MRCSGDQNTSLGNCVLSLLLVSLFCRENGITEFDVLCDGDDLLLFVPACELPRLRKLCAWYLRWGMRMKVEPPAYVPEAVEFCQSKVVLGPAGWVLVRNPSKVFNTDFAGGAKLERLEDYEAHLRSVGVCGLAMAAGIPLLQEYYLWAIRSGKTGRFCDRELGGLAYQYRIQVAGGHDPKACAVSPETRESFALAFGVEPHEQLDIEDTIRNMVWSRHDDPCDQNVKRIFPQFA